MNIFTKMRQSLLFAAALLCAGGTFAQEPDLTDYTLVTSYKFDGSVDLAVGSDALAITAYETGNKRQQKIYPATAPEGIVGWMAFQGIKGTKGWWNRSGWGMYCYGAERSAAVYGENLTLGSIVVFTCSQTASNVMTLTNGSGEPDGTFTYQLSDDGKTYYCTVTAEENGYVGFCGVKNNAGINSISIYQPNNAVVVSTYSIKYVDGEGNELKEQTVCDGISGDAISLANSYKQMIINGDAGYIYVSDDAEGKTIASDGSTVVTVTFRDAETWSYTANAVDEEGNVLKSLVSAENFETVKVGVPYNQYIFKDGVLYETEADNKDYHKYFTLSADCMTATVTYSVSSLENVVYFSEAEEIEGMTTTTGGNANIRCSNAAGGYNASAEPVVVTTLTPGVYNIVAQVWGNSGVEFNIVCGDNTLKVATAGYILSGNTEFVVTEETEVVVLPAGANGKCLDWIYIQSVEKPLVVTDGEDLTATGSYSSASYVRLFNTEYTYGTICLPFAPDAATCENYTFYKLAEVNSEALIFEEEAAPKANTAYLYKLNDGADAEAAKTFTGGVTTISDVEVKSVGGWNFIGSFARTEITDLTGGDYWAYQATYNDKKDVLVKAGTKLVAHPYRAYFKFVPTEEVNFTPAAATMRMIIGGKEGGAMEIQEVIAPEQVEGAAFDLEGRPVENMQKGQIYIIGGKKVKK